jgi:hypothetical protein
LDLTKEAKRSLNLGKLNLKAGLGGGRIDSNWHSPRIDAVREQRCSAGLYVFFGSALPLSCAVFRAIKPNKPD